MMSARVAGGGNNSRWDSRRENNGCARGLVAQLELPAIGAAESIANPLRFSRTPVSYRLPLPLLGKLTSEILQSLGYSAEVVLGMAAESTTQGWPSPANWQEPRGGGGSRGGYESVWQLGLTPPLYWRERRSAGWPIFWSTTRSKPICCHQP